MNVVAKMMAECAQKQPMSPKRHDASHPTTTWPPREPQPLLLALSSVRPPLPLRVRDDVPPLARHSHRVHYSWEMHPESNVEME